MKLYGDFNKEEWKKYLNLKDEEIPSSIIIHGEWNYEDNIKLWKKKLKHNKLFKWNTLIGNYKSKLISFSNVYGSPMTSLISHQFAVLGTENFIQTGYFGGLSPQVKYGDILIVTHAVMEDGVSNNYILNQKIVSSNRYLVNKAIEYCEINNFNYVLGYCISIGSFMYETIEMVENWSEKGYLGVDMETATTLSIAKKYNKKAIALLNLSDHLLMGDNLYLTNKERDELENDTDFKIRELALYLSTL